MIGIDGLEAGTYVSPRLTTVAVDMDAVAAATVEIALKLERGEASGSRLPRRTVRPRLVAREST